MTYHTVYQITNKINGKIYIGVHQTSDLDDGYMGSGLYIKRAIKKHGIENFTKQYLRICESEEEMFIMEADIVDQPFICRKDTYNIQPGGGGGWSIDQQKENNRRSQIKQKQMIKDDPEFLKMRQEIGRKNFSDAHKEGKIPYDNFKGKTHKEESKKKMRASHEGKHVGKLNSQYGTMWITTGTKNKKIKKTDHIPVGWKKGCIRIKTEKANG